MEAGKENCTSEEWRSALNQCGVWRSVDGGGGTAGDQSHYVVMEDNHEL